MAGSKLLALLAGASIAVACGGVFVGHKAVSQTEAYIKEAQRWKGQADESAARLAVLKGRLADAERRLAEARKGLTRDERIILASHVSGRPGTLAFENRNPCNVKELSGGRKWRGQVGVDKQGHCRFSSIQYGLRAAVFTLRSYEKKHNIKTLKGIVDRFCGGNSDYVAFLSRRMKLSPEEEFSITARMPELIRFMSAYESGREVSPDMIATLDILTSL